MPGRTEVLLIYVTGLIQGWRWLHFQQQVPFSPVLTVSALAIPVMELFIPQVILAILASSLGPRLAQRWTLKNVLLSGLAADLLR